MQPQSGLSKELVELCDRVSNQADEYADLFLNVRRRTVELDALRLDMQTSLKDFKLQSADELEVNRTMIESGLKRLSDDMLFVRSVYADIDSIRELRDALIELRATFYERTIEMDTVIHSIRTYVQKETANQFMEFERRLSAKLQAIDAAIEGFDARLLKIQDLHQYEFTALSDDLSRFKNKVSDIKHLVDMANRTLGDVDNKIKSGFDAITHDGILKQRIDRVKIETQSLERRVSEMDGSIAVRATIGLWLGAAAVLGVLLVAIF
jgi:predicted  nucleic acid-binding Zn-ribbon protein